MLDFVEGAGEVGQLGAASRLPQPTGLAGESPAGRRRRRPIVEAEEDPGAGRRGVDLHRAEGRFPSRLAPVEVGHELPVGAGQAEGRELGSGWC